METYISLLRGVNMLGRNRIRMRELAAVYESMGFGRVTTYIQSGNVIFTSRKRQADRLENTLSSAIKEAFGLQIAVFIRTAAQWREAMAACPFEETEGSKNIYVTFLLKPPSIFPEEEVKRIKQPGDEVSLCGREMFFYLPDGYGKTKLSNNFVETKLNVTATTRNWRTVNKLRSLIEAE